MFFYLNQLLFVVRVKFYSDTGRVFALDLSTPRRDRFVPRVSRLTNQDERVQNHVTSTSFFFLIFMGLARLAIHKIDVYVTLAFLWFLSYHTPTYCTYIHTMVLFGPQSVHTG